MPEKIEKCISRGNLIMKIALLDLDDELKDENKFKSILRNCDEISGKFIIDEKISSWSQLTKTLPSENKFADKILTVCSSKKETKSEYIKRICHELNNYGCTEGKIVNFSQANFGLQTQCKV
ncbi:hypothetical protein NGRA_2595 [Nosema granulosis]|uniref:Uncharacterized protein n=1 Tax=Nosema granulosis TaxID=83296 RepID=A0A9P6GZK0_9MICR|nr:hypothetical protein NGRA_2595 [Nosema granulosis]